MVDKDGNSLIPLKLALYGPAGLFPDVRLRDAKRVFGSVITIRSKYSPVRVSYIRQDSFDKAKAKLNKMLNC